MTSTTFFIIFIPILSILLLSINLVLAPHNAYQEKDSVFECGFHSFLGQNRTQFSVSFFIFGLLFLLFDLEILLVYPYSVSGYNNDLYGLIIMMIFFILLTLGFVFELGKNALTIDSKQTFTYDSKYIPKRDIFIIKSKISFKWKLILFLTLAHMKIFSYMIRQSLSFDLFNMALLTIIYPIVMVTATWLICTVERTRFVLGIIKTTLIVLYLLVLLVISYLAYFGVHHLYIADFIIYFEEVVEYYCLGMIMKMVSGRPSGTGSSIPKGGAAGASGTSGTGSSIPQGGAAGASGTSGTGSSIPTSPDLSTLDRLLMQLNNQIKQGVGPSQKTLLQSLEEDLNKLDAWEKFVGSDLPKKLAPLSPYYKYLTDREMFLLRQFSEEMARESKDVFNNNRRVKISEYASAHKNISNKQKDNYRRWFAMHKPIIDRLDAEEAKIVTEIISKAKEDLEYKQKVKIEITTRLVENSKSYQDRFEKNS